MQRKELEQLGERIAEHAAHLDAATHRLLTDLRAFDEAGGWAQQGARSCAQWLSWRVGWDLVTARQHVRVAKRLAELPEIDDALRRGELSYSKVRAMTRVATPQNETVLLEEARFTTGAQLESICRKYAVVQRHEQDPSPEEDRLRRYVTRRDTDDGMVRIVAVIHPEEAAIVWAALERGAAERCRDAQRAAKATPNEADPPASAETPTEGAEAPASSSAPPAANTNAAKPYAPARHSEGFDRADALVDIAQDVLRGRRRSRNPVDVLLLMPRDSLITPDPAKRTREPCSKCHGASTCEHVTDGDPSRIAAFQDGTCISAAAALRLTCDCGIVDATTDEHGNVISMGRKRRTISPALKRAMLCRDRTCRFPGCTARVFLQGHHAKHWAHGGETTLDNVFALCAYHHRFVHEYGYRIVHDQDGTHFYDDRGRLVTESPAPLQPPGLGWDAILERNAELDIDADTPACGWDGERVDYGACVSALCVADDATESGRVRVKAA